MRNGPRLDGPALRVLGSRSRPDVPWVAKVAGVTEDQAGRTLRELAWHRRVVDELTSSIGGTGRNYYAQFPAPLDLYALVRLAEPRTLVESGVSSGVSSTFMLLGAAANGRGRLHSIDYPVSRTRRRGGAPWAIPPGLSSGWGVPESLRQGWDLRIGRSEDLLKPLLDELGPLDFYCHDSPVDVGHFRFEMETILGHLGPGSLVVADNTDWEIFESAARSMGATAVRRKGSDLGAFRVP